MKCLGLMSGTSADGVDCAIVDITPSKNSLNLHLLASQTMAYPPALREQVLNTSTQGNVGDVCHLNVAVGEVFARTALRTIEKAGLVPENIALIGSHGQTLYHQPTPRQTSKLGRLRSSLQVGDPSLIAERTGITTVADFRMRDIAAGGEGAPLAPYVHHLCFHSTRRSRLIVNLGGIANVTFLPKKDGLDDVRAFDTGPCNMLLDGLVAHGSRGKVQIDRGGHLARKGKTHHGLLAKLLTHPYLSQCPPKSTGRETFGSSFIAEVVEEAKTQGLTLEQILATSCDFIARTIVDSCLWLPGPVDEIILGGGGVKNGALRQALTEAFHPRPVLTMDHLGVDSKAFEAMAFAVLGYQTIRGEPTNVPSVTGATHAVIMGVIAPGRNRLAISLEPLWR